MPNLARRYLDLLEECKALRELYDEQDRAEHVDEELRELWAEMSVEERLAVERAVLE